VVSVIIDFKEARIERELWRLMGEIEDFVVEETLAGRPVIIIIEKPTVWEIIKRWFRRG